jgi:hypothetical protein
VHPTWSASKQIAEVITADLSDPTSRYTRLLREAAGPALRELRPDLSLQREAAQLLYTAAGAAYCGKPRGGRHGRPGHGHGP